MAEVAPNTTASTARRPVQRPRSGPAPTAPDEHPGDEPLSGAQPTDEQLLVASCTDPQAFGELYLRHGERLFAYLRPRCGDTQDAYDLVSETMAEAFGARHRFDPSKGDAGAWLFGIARNLLRQYARRGAVDERARRRLGLDVGRLQPDDVERLEHSIDLRGTQAQLGPALGRLPNRLGDAVRLRCLDGHSYEEVANMLDITSATARKRVSRALALLEHHLPDNPFAAHG